MSLWLIAQISFNVITTLIIIVLWEKLKRPPQEDPRLSRGLQLLQSKIAIIENLSDKTEDQFKNINELIEKKTEKLQKFIIKSEEQVGRLENSITKSNEIANIFQDKIPHQEVIERKQSMQMITAARMAHHGSSVEEIVDKVKLPRAQVELITKVNKTQLVFDEGNLPAWVKQMEGVEFDTNEVLELGNSTEAPTDSKSEAWVEEATERVFSQDSVIDSEQMQRIKSMGDEFKALCNNYEERQRQLDYDIENNLTQKMLDGAERAGTVVAKNIGEASHSLAQNVGEVSQVVAKNVGEVSQVVAQNVSKNLNEVSGKVKVKASAVSGRVMSHVSEVSKKVADNASSVGGRIVEKTGRALESKSNREKTKVQKVKFPELDSDKDLF